jgi:hypothetical protein
LSCGIQIVSTPCLNFAANQAESSEMKLRKYKGTPVSKSNSLSTRLSLSFRPLVFVWGHSEHSRCWQVGFAALNVLARAICGLAKGDALFAMCCADGAASGHLGFKTCFPGGLWLQCWVHVLRKFDAKTSELAPGLPAADKRKLRDWFKKEVKAMFRCVGQVKWRRCVAQCSAVCTIQIV